MHIKKLHINGICTGMWNIKLDRINQIIITICEESIKKNTAYVKHLDQQSMPSLFYSPKCYEALFRCLGTLCHCVLRHFQVRQVNEGRVNTVCTYRIIQFTNDLHYGDTTRINRRQYIPSFKIRRYWP